MTQNCLDLRSLLMSSNRHIADTVLTITVSSMATVRTIADTISSNQRGDAETAMIAATFAARKQLTMMTSNATCRTL